MKRVTGGEVSVHIDARPQKVYELVSDVTRMGEWSPETHRCHWVDASGPAVGACFKAYNRRGRIRWSNTPEVVVADPGREFAFRRSVPWCGVMDWRYRFEPDGTGTLVTESYEVVEPEWAITTWLNRVLTGIEDRDADLAEGMRTTLERIKHEAERERSSSRAGRS